MFLQELGSINVVQSLVNSSNISIFESLHFICNFSVPKSILKEEAISKNCYFYCPINQNSSGVCVAEQEIGVGEPTTHAGESQEKSRRKNYEIKGEITQKIKLSLNDTNVPSARCIILSHSAG